MSTRAAKLIDASRGVVACAAVGAEGDHFEGTIDLRATPPALRALFDDFEEIVNGQMFSFLDDIQEKIAALSIRVVFDDCCEGDVKDLQVFPSTGDVSFRLAESLVPAPLGK